MEEQPESIQVPLSSLIGIAIECWRLEHWLAGSQRGGSNAMGRHVARRLAELLTMQEITIIDMTGQPYEPGFAVEVVDTVTDKAAPEGVTVIDETIAPIVMWRGAVVRHGMVVTRKRPGAEQP